MRPSNITDIQESNVKYVKRILEAGVDVRHIAGNRIGFSVSQTEYLNHYQDPGQGPESVSVVYSNNHDLVMQMGEMYRVLWKAAVPAEARIKQMEMGLGPGETRVVADLEESNALGRGLLERVDREVLIILASARTLERNAGMYEVLLEKARQKGLDVRILAPVSEHRVGREGKVEIRRIESIPLGVAIYDRKAMLITQYVDPEAADSKQAFLANIYTTDSQTISGMIAMFDALWRESKRTAEEEKERAQAQLLQDILTHDIRNYNQIALMATENLQDGFKGIAELREPLAQIEAAIMGSTDLVEKASRLGRILSQKKPSTSVDLLECVRASLQRTRDSNREKRVHDELRVPSQDVEHPIPITVMADDLLGDAFVNVYSNCLRYSEGEEVAIETVVDSVEEEREGIRRPFWRVSISDKGPGIPEELREQFVRYKEGSHGKGLGLSIVHTLVVGRYSGLLSIRNRSESEKTHGTRVEISLPKAGV